MFGQPHPRTLHLYYRDGHHQLEVCDEDKQTVLYRVYRNSSKPHLTICRASGPNNDEKCVPGNPLSMKKTGLLSSNFAMHGDGIAWKWERDGTLTSNLKLTAADGSCLAKLDNASWSRSKQGTLTLDALIETGLG